MIKANLQSLYIVIWGFTHINVRKTYSFNFKVDHTFNWLSHHAVFTIKHFIKENADNYRACHFRCTTNKLFNKSPTVKKVLLVNILSNKTPTNTSFIIIHVWKIMNLSTFEKKHFFITFIYIHIKKIYKNIFHVFDIYK